MINDEYGDFLTIEEVGNVLDCSSQRVLGLVRTGKLIPFDKGENGEFIFENLQVGNYKVYVVGDQANSSNMPEEVSQNVLIEVKESIKDIGILQIYF